MASKVDAKQKDFKRAVHRSRGARRRATIVSDPYRTILFPNAVRERRLEAGIASQMELCTRLPQLAYIRLSKIERGEVFARATELWAIAGALGLDDPADLLIDIDAPGFSIEAWAGERVAASALARETGELAMLLAAAVRRLRAGQPALTLARLLEEYRLPAVTISRMENAIKPFHRWNAETIGALCALFGVPDKTGLIALLWSEFETGTLEEWLARIPGASEREARARERIAALRTELARMKKDGRTVGSQLPDAAAPSVPREGQRTSGRHLPVLGVPLGDGLIEPFPNPQHIAPPPGTGVEAYALRMCRASLGAAIPGGAVLIVDPERIPASVGLAVLREGVGLRVLALSTDREGRLIGHSSNPEKTILLDAVAPADLAMVTAVLFP
ncbi:helix-turn-helix transcriptional regulator [Sphingobium sp. DEHP117]|uniref:helix-turn-helix domain-containing protein n=1 Tax=Sphingobium sp. DEHP117 TaxID=2993436 RepID=UPI0027D6D2CA|nr:helix-turn-helix transcriptional regulator [Sphingobium sp. DEHP117]MDQ4421169.1 helix-turn-helix transcriptional regulator [Sphingobium sp. DEHP117]